MNILWIKDNNIGHEKQVKVLLDELSKTRDINIIQINVKGFHPFFKYVDPVEENLFDLIIGAGHKTYSFILDIKKSQKKSCKTVAILAPSFNKDKFDLICAPDPGTLCARAVRLLRIPCAHARCSFCCGNIFH